MLNASTVTNNQSFLSLMNTCLYGAQNGVQADIDFLEHLQVVFLN